MWRKNFAWKMSSLLLGGGLAFIFQLALMRHLGPHEYGRWSLAVGWAGLFSVLVDYGFNPLAARDISRRPQDARHYLLTILRGKIFLAIGGAGLLALIWRFKPPSNVTGALLTFAFIYLCSISTAESLQSVTYAIERFRTGAFLALLQKALPSTVGLCAIFWAWPENHLFAGVSFGALIAVMLCIGYVTTLLRPGKTATAQTMSSLLTAGLPLFLQNFFILIYFRVDTIMIGHYTTPDQAGIYSAAYRFFELSNVVPTALLAAWTASLSVAIEKSAASPLFYAALRIFVIAAIAAVVLLHILALAAPHLLGAKYAAVLPVLAALSWTALFYFPNYLLSSMTVLLGKPAWNMILAAGCAILNILMNIVAIPRWGAQAAIWTTLITEAALTAGSLGVVLRLRRAPNHGDQII